jgi:hypothetical protein
MRYKSKYNSWSFCGKQCTDILPSGFSIHQTTTALKKAWKGFRIAKGQDDEYRMKKYAIIIQKLERELGIAVNSFPDIGIESTAEFDVPMYDYNEFRG